MKWILCGKNDAAVDCLRFLVERGDEVWAIGTRGDDGTDGWQRSFKLEAERLQVPFDQPQRINDPTFVERLAAARAQALISIQYDQILRGPLFNAIGCPCLNLHFALLPRHRGVAPIAWALASGDREAGVTLHHMIEDIDAGNIIARQAVPIHDGDTAREIYDRVSAAAVSLFKASHPFPDELLGRSLPQDPATASYHRSGDFDFTRRQIDWRRPAVELHRWIRAMIFPPMQYPETGYKGRLHQVTRIAGELGEPVSAAPGVVVARSPAGIDVAAADRPIRVRGLIDPNHPEASAAEILARVFVGERFMWDQENAS